VSLKKARTKALQRLSDIGDGADPVADRELDGTRTTVAALCKTFYERHCEPEFNATGRVIKGKKSWKMDLSRIDRHIKPNLGNLQVGAVTRQDIAQLHTRIGKKHPYEANRVLALLRVMFNKVRDWGLVSSSFPNPAEGIEKFKEHARNRWVTPTELTALAKAIEQFRGQGNRETMVATVVKALRENALMTIAEATAVTGHSRDKTTQLLAYLNARDPRVERVRPGVYRYTECDPDDLPETREAPYIRAAIWIILLTGARKNEILRLTWRDTDLDRAEIRFPDTKSGRSHVVPLSPPAVTILSNLPKKKENPFVFCGRKHKKGLVNIDRAWRSIRKAAGLEDVRLHDLRRSAASWMAQAGAPLLVLKSALGHSNVRTTEKVYAQLSQDPVRRALDDYGKQVMAAAGDTRSEAKVIALRKGDG